MASIGTQSVRLRKPSSMSKITARMVCAILILPPRHSCHLTLRSILAPITMDGAINFLSDSKAGVSWLMFSRRAPVILVVRSIPVKRVGYSGLMLPPLEDSVLAQGWSEGAYRIDALLAYSAVCGTGLDAIPLPGDVSQQQLERIIGDVASLAVKWHKPLTARLIPAPGKKAGERTDFDFGITGFPNVILQKLP